MPPMDAVLSTAPPCSAIQALTASEVHSSGAHRLTSKVLVNRPWSCSINGPYAGLVPALFTRMSMLPNRSSVRSTQRLAASSSTACAATPRALSPICAAAASALSCLREVTTTFAPASASCCAIANPIPRDAPVMIAVRPVRSNDMSAHFGDLDRGGLVSVLAQFLTGDGTLVHLVRAVGEAQRAQVRPRQGKREVVGHPAAAVHLNRSVDDRQRDLRSRHLDRRDLRLRCLVADRVHQVCGLEREQPDHLDVDACLGDPVLDVGVLADRFAEGDAGLRPLAHQFQCPLGHADCTHAVVDAAGPEACLADREALAFALEHVFEWHPHVLEVNFGVALAVLIPEYR